jgi:hypothetical protein
MIGKKQNRVFSPFSWFDPLYFYSFQFRSVLLRSRESEDVWRLVGSFLLSLVFGIWPMPVESHFCLQIFFSLLLSSVLGCVCVGVHVRVCVSEGEIGFLLFWIETKRVRMRLSVYFNYQGVSSDSILSCESTCLEFISLSFLFFFPFSTPLPITSPFSSVLIDHLPFFLLLFPPTPYPISHLVL